MEFIRDDLTNLKGSVQGIRGKLTTAHAPPTVDAVHGDWYTLAEFGSLKLTIGCYIDSLTIAMFCMVTLIASCIHFYALGYMHEELHDVTDAEADTADGRPLIRPGRF